MSEEENLKKHIQELEEKLAVAQSWMRREIESQTKVIIQERENEELERRDTHLQEEITENISSFFWDILLLQAPEETLENLIRSEVEYRFLSLWYQIEPLSVIISYQKILDAWIERYITKGFRKYAEKKQCVHLKVNNPLEKIFHSVVTERYILWVNKFLSSLLCIQEGGELTPYIQCFSLYISEKTSLWNLMKNQDFKASCNIILKKDFFGGKRHSGNISQDDISELRRIMVGNWKDKNCLLYKLFETEKIDI